MNTKAAGRQVRMFRCHIDPMIGPKSRNAFVPKDMGAEAYINDEATGVIIRLANGREHFVFSANVQSIELESDNDVVTLKPKRSAAV